MASEDSNLDGEKARLKKYGNVETIGRDVEDGIQLNVCRPERDEPFGDESNNELKYRTMAWWYSLRSTILRVHN